MSLLGLDLLFASADAVKALLQATAHAVAICVASADTRGRGCGRSDVCHTGVIGTLTARMAGGHFCARVSKVLMVFECLLNGVRGFALAFKVVGMIFLKLVRYRQ